ncbi:MAG TPA: hypothetical protein VLY24_05720, partial [Bryobacteraceae bacterium]|nr:hypothetical protein [Bryobacteraceae bacterium]
RSSRRRFERKARGLREDLFQHLFPLPPLRANLKCLHDLNLRTTAAIFSFSLRLCVSAVIFFAVCISSWSIFV